jgi:hypothetical protein
MEATTACAALAGVMLSRHSADVFSATKTMDTLSAYVARVAAR